MQIRKATSSDLGHIHHLAEAHALNREDIRHATGFLVSTYSLSDYEHLLAQAEYFYVAESDSRIVGFIVAYSEKFVVGDFPTTRLEAYTGPHFIVIKQVCVDTREARRGTGSKLYRHLMNETLSSPLVAAIVLQPENRVSINFHRKLGFRQLLTFTPSDGMLRGVWGRGFEHAG
jgi:ribosomal protein S18 acetylase RimI-like enzyme